MKTLIKIDRSSIRENPDAGKTEFTIAGPQACTVVKGGCVYESVGELVSKDGNISGLFVMTQAINAPLVAGEKYMKFSSEDSIIGIRRDAIHTKVGIPGPDFFYDYLPTTVTCRCCGSAFDHSQLKTEWAVGLDGDDAPIENVCPRCGSFDCCDIEYEKIESAIRGDQ